MGGKYIVNQTAGSRVIILEENDESIQGGYFDTEGEWHELSGPLDGILEGRYVINETDGKRIVLLEEDAENIGGGYFEEDSTWVPFGSAWDLEWDYTMGVLPSDAGFSINITGTAQNTLTDEGYRMAGNNGSITTIRFSQDPFKDEKGTLEFTFKANLNGGSNTSRNLIFSIGNDTNGVAINTSRNAFRLYSNSEAGSGTSVHAYVNETEYTAKLVLDGDEYRFYLDNTLLSSGEATSMYNASTSYLQAFNIIGANGFYVLLKSIKFKAGVIE